MRYWAVIFLLIFGLSAFSGCGKSPEGDTNYNELKNTPPPEKEEPGEGVTTSPQ